MKKILRRIGWVAISLFLFVNVVVALHAWQFTHFSRRGVRYQNPASLSLIKKISIALTGVDNPRPIAKRLPSQAYEEIHIQSNVTLDCWHIKTTKTPKGTVILFHGYGGEKSSMLDKADYFLNIGYNVLLPDFMGAGASGGNQTTIGFTEAENVKDCVRFVSDRYREKNIILMGTSMGAAAILKYLDNGNPQPSGIIIECPFGSMYETVCARFKMMHAPTFPLAGLLVFWGGTENGFWAFNHNPDTYAKSVRCPALLMFGERDDRVSRDEINAIYSHLAGPKTLKTFPLAGHNDSYYLYKNEWQNSVNTFLENNLQQP